MTRTIKDLIENIIPAQHAWKIKLIDQWSAIFGHLSSNVFPILIKDRTLIVGVTHPIWAQELHMLEATFKAKINASIGSQSISAISFRVMSKPKNKNTCAATSDNSSVSDQKQLLQLNPAEQKVLKTVGDEQFKTAMHQFLIRCKLKKRMSS